MVKLLQYIGGDLGILGQYHALKFLDYFRLQTFSDAVQDRGWLVLDTYLLQLLLHFIYYFQAVGKFLLEVANFVRSVLLVFIRLVPSVPTYKHLAIVAERGICDAGFVRHLVEPHTYRLLPQVFSDLGRLINHGVEVSFNNEGLGLVVVASKEPVS